MKKLFALVLALTFLTAFFTYASADTIYLVNTEETGINVRANPQGEIIGGIPKGTLVTSLGVVKYDGCDWVMVQYGDQIGYLFGEYMAKVAEDYGCYPCPVYPQIYSNPAPSNDSQIDRIPGIDPNLPPPELDWHDAPLELMQVESKSGLNIRKDHGRKYDILVRAINGAYVWLIETYESPTYIWGHVIYQVRPDGKIRHGWADMSYL